MKKHLRKDLKKRIIVKKVETELFILKNIFKNLNFSTLVRWNAFLKILDLPKNTSKVRLRKRCVITGRQSSFNPLYKFSRLVFLRLVRSGEISNVRKSSW